jgi:hypothetical protein
MAKAKAKKQKIPISWDQVDEWLVCHCSGAEIAGMLGIHPDTLYDRCLEEKKMRFIEYAAAKKSKGKGKLKIKQFQEALAGDRGMLIWLGKQHLEQKDNHDVKVSGEMKIGVINFGTQDSPKPWSDSADNEKKCGE